MAAVDEEWGQVVSIEKRPQGIDPSLPCRETENLPWGQTAPTMQALDPEAAVVE